MELQVTIQNIDQEGSSAYHGAKHAKRPQLQTNTAFRQHSSGNFCFIASFPVGRLRDTG